VPLPLADPAPAPEDRGPFAWLGRTLGLAPRTVEWVAGVVLAVLAVALTAYLARDLWFLKDEWEYLTNRSAGDLDSLLRPIGGHWTTWSVFLLRGLYRAVGLDYWPWYYLPRLVGHTLLAIFVWRVLRWRGADPTVAFGAFAVFLLLGASAYQRALQVGNWAVYAALLTAAVLITRRERPTVLDRVLVALALLVGVLGNGYAVAVLGGITGALLIGRRLLRWLPSLVLPIAAYVSWYLAYRDEIRPRPKLTVEKLRLIPGSAFRVVRSALETATGLPEILAGVLVIALAAWVVWLIVRRRLDQFDWIILGTLGLGLILLTIQRVAVESEAANSLRYGYSIDLLLILLLVPHVRLPRTFWAPLGVAMLTAVLVVVNVDTMQEAIDTREAIGQASRPIVEAAAAMIDAGEPVVDGPSVVVEGLETDELVRLVQDGYHPDGDLTLSEARAALRIGVVDLARNREDYDPEPGPPVALAEGEPRADGCVTASEDHTVTAVVEDATVLEVTKGPSTLFVTWRDEFGEGTRTVGPEVREALLALAHPTTTADLTLSTGGDPIEVCGFAPA
jgi:hypothetical protein